MRKEIKIGWRVYQIVKTSPSLNSGDELYGQIDHARQTITLRAANTAQQDMATLLHELLHALDDYFDLHLDEHAVIALANGLCSVIVDNGLQIEEG